MLKNLSAIALASVAMFLPATLSTAAAEKLAVVASFSIIADFARNVGGDRIDLTTLVGPNGDAHAYQPTPADAAAMADADLVLVNGLQFEGFLQRLVEASATKAGIVEVAEGVKLLEAVDDAHGDEPEEAGHDDHAGGAPTGEGNDDDEAETADGEVHGENDPHAWQSVHNAETYVKNIADAFCAADAAGCDIYTENADAYTAKLEALDQEIRAAAAAIPEDRRVIITSHDAFGYFAREYGIRFLAPEGVSTESEASAADVAALIEQVRQDKASAIFVESITNPRLIEQIASETNLKVGGELYSDALSNESGPAATYLDMMRHNIQTIAGAITGS